MHKILFALFFICSLSIYSQNTKGYKVEYELKFKLDTLQKEYFQENFVLLFDEKSSYCSSEKILAQIHDPGMKNGEIDMGKVMRNKTLFLEKTYYSPQGLYCYMRASTVDFYYPQDIPKWEVKNETKKINGIVCKMAETSFLGRRWTAWYTEDYPVSYGPYKLVGLPGLILEAYDDKNTYIFSGVEIKKEAKVAEQIPISKGSTKLVTKNDFFAVMDGLLYDTDILTKYGDLFKNYPKERIEFYKRYLIEKRKKRNNFPIDKDIKRK